VALAIFDLDETLIAIDSDHAWGQYAIDRGLVDAEEHQHQNDQFYADYKRGELNINAYLAFTCSMLPAFSIDELDELRKDFATSVIKPYVLPKAQYLVNQHRGKNDHLLVITATNRFIAEPIVDFFHIDTLIAPTPEIQNNQYTGKVLGTPSYGEGKVTCLNEWIITTKKSMDGSFFYSDSHNDLPLLRMVTHPVAVDPDDILKKEAENKEWPIISLRS
tara:strand:- start:429 stop:1085 length:657 start_codon:yes stop_codon:yes gene_type:complete